MVNEADLRYACAIKLLGNRDTTPLGPIGDLMNRLDNHTYGQPDFIKNGPEYPVRELQQRVMKYCDEVIRHRTGESDGADIATHYAGIEALTAPYIAHAAEILRKPTPAPHDMDKEYYQGVHAVTQQQLTDTVMQVLDDHTISPTNPPTKSGQQR